MNLAETGDLLTYAAMIDNRRYDEATVIAWQSILADIGADDAMRAVREHFADSAEYLMPVHVVAGARALVEERRRAKVARRNAEKLRELEAQRGTATDRRAEIAAAIRATQPESKPDVLRPREARWRRDRVIQRDAIPNPAFAGFRLPEPEPEGGER